MMRAFDNNVGRCVVGCGGGGMGGGGGVFNTIPYGIYSPLFAHIYYNMYCGWIYISIYIILCVGEHYKWELGGAPLLFGEHRRVSARQGESLRITASEKVGLRKNFRFFIRFFCSSSSIATFSRGFFRKFARDLANFRDALSPKIIQLWNITGENFLLALQFLLFSPELLHDL